MFYRVSELVERPFKGKLDKAFVCCQRGGLKNLDFRTFKSFSIENNFAQRESNQLLVARQFLCLSASYRLFVIMNIISDKFLKVLLLWFFSKCSKSFST